MLSSYGIIAQMMSFSDSQQGRMVERTARIEPRRSAFTDHARRVELPRSSCPVVRVGNRDFFTAPPNGNDRTSAESAWLITQRRRISRVQKGLPSQQRSTTEYELSKEYEITKKDRRVTASTPTNGTQGSKYVRTGFVRRDF